MPSKGATRAQLQSKLDSAVREVEELREKLKPDPLRKRGEHWYELVEHFDPQLIERMPLKKGRGFIMGRLDAFTVIEVNDDVEVEHVGKWLAERGIRALIVKEGIRFLKLRTVSAEMEGKLDATELAAEDADDAETDSTASP